MTLLLNRRHGVLLTAVLLFLPQACSPVAEVRPGILQGYLAPERQVARKELSALRSAGVTSPSDCVAEVLALSDLPDEMLWPANR